MQTNAAGQAVIKLETPGRDGTVYRVMSPQDFFRQLAAQSPRPRLHLIRFHGVLTPNAMTRTQAEPQLPEPPRPPAIPDAVLHALRRVAQDAGAQFRP